ncbi:MAG: hypothetical protein JSR39_01740 [Verrucomicrobia bacterium]|nr:hypothetical protein [Verrucomicrobiota bacterium]
MSVRKVPHTGNQQQEAPRVHGQTRSKIEGIKSSLQGRIFDTINGLSKSFQSTKSDKPSDLKERSGLAASTANQERKSTACFAKHVR